MPKIDLSCMSGAGATWYVNMYMALDKFDKATLILQGQDDVTFHNMIKSEHNKIGEFDDINDQIVMLKNKIMSSKSEINGINKSDIETENRCNGGNFNHVTFEWIYDIQINLVQSYQKY